MITITLASLPTDLFATQLIYLQLLATLIAVQEALRQYWDIALKDKWEAQHEEGKSGVSDALATHTGRKVIRCLNCKRNGHSIERCWAAGGGQEGKAPQGWKAPMGKEPKQTTPQT